MTKKPASVVQAINIATKIRQEAEKDDINGIIYAAKYILSNLSSSEKQSVTLTEKVARDTVFNFVQHLLNNDQFEAAATILWGAGVYDWRPQSAADTWKCLFDYDKLLVQGAGAMGKCLLKGTQVIMSDGTLKNVEDVKIGDKVMGPDSNPRNVVDLHSGISPMYRVDQERGESYTVTDDHILTLICTGNKKNGDNKTISSTYTTGKIIDIGLQEYLKSSKQFKSLYKGFSTGVHFNEQVIPMDAYVFGLWLGDGNGKGERLGLTTMDDVIRDTWIQYWEEKGCQIVKTEQINNKSSVYHVKGAGTIKKVMSFALKENEKTIPDCYKLNSRVVRLNVLAGFIDTDGYAAGPGYGYIQKNKDVAYSIAFIARSLGLDVTVKECRKRCVNNGVWGTYYRGHISGDCSVIPCKLKKCDARKVKVSIGKKINITPVGDGEYYGFVLDGDKRFLLSDFTITHNTFNAAAWFLMDWMRDPEYTCIKVVSLTEAHAQRNVFAAIKTFYRTALVRPEYEGSEDLVKSIQANDDDKNGIHLVAVPKGDSGTGTLRGFHPAPRTKPHPRWGQMSRTHVVLDEAEEVPAGVWEGLQNILSAADTRDSKGRIKIFGASNPKDRNSEFGKRCEPQRGWQSIDCEEDFEWESREGWHVLRLDAARCENVTQKRIIFPGFQSYEGYMAYESRGKTAEYYTMARGFFPQEGISMAIITPAMMDNALGIVRFIGPVVPLAAFDLALEGRDQVICSFGRFGLTDGWTPRDGKFIEFKKPKVCLQLDSQMQFPKLATLEQTAEIIRFAKEMRIGANWLCVDRTGNGAGIHDSLKSLYGSEVMGVNYSWAASETHVLGDDTQRANELYSGVVTELIFGLAKYIEFEYLKISPSFKTEDLIRQATSRRYKQQGQGLVRVESKGDYVKRTRQHSPDALDSLSLLVYLMRQRGGAVATMTEQKPEKFVFEKKYNGIESYEFVDFSE